MDVSRSFLQRRILSAAINYADDIVLTFNSGHDVPVDAVADRETRLDLAYLYIERFHIVQLDPKYIH